MKHILAKWKTSSILTPSCDLLSGASSIPMPKCSRPNGKLFSSCAQFWLVNWRQVQCLCPVVTGQMEDGFSSCAQLWLVKQKTSSIPVSSCDWSNGRRFQFLCPGVNGQMEEKFISCAQLWVAEWNTGLSLFTDTLTTVLQVYPNDSFVDVVMFEQLCVNIIYITHLTVM